jgi:hypothetical protein
VDGPEADFFALGGGSLSAAQLVAALRGRYPQVTVADLYDHPRLGSLAGFLDELDPPPRVQTRVVAPMPLLSQAFQVAMSLPLATLTGLQWVVWLALINNVAAVVRPVPWLVPIDWWWIVGGFLLFVSPVGRMAIAVLSARMLIGFLKPGTYRRGGSVHLRVWIAERLADASGAENLAGAPWMVYYARALGNKVGKGVDLHSTPPVTGMLTLGHRSSIEPEVDLSGHWIDGDHFYVGTITIGNDSTIGARTTLLPGLLGALRRNDGRGSHDLALFETGLVFRPTGHEHRAERLPVDRRPTDEEIAEIDSALPRQPRRAAVVLAGAREQAGWWGKGRPADWADAVEAARTVAREAGVELTVRGDRHAPWHPGRCAALYATVNGEETLVGHAGELHPRVVKALHLPERSCAMEIELDLLEQAGGGVPAAPRISTFPVATQDVALVVARDVPAAEVEAALREGAGELLESVRLFDVYEGEQLGEGRKSLAYALRFRAGDRTLTVDEASAARDAAVALAGERTGAVLRS